MKVGFKPRISRVEKRYSGNTFDIFFWGVIAGVAGTLVILFYVFHSS